MSELFESLGLGPKPPDDNVVFYTIYPDQQPADEAQLLALRARCFQAIQPLLSPGYIWQVEPFSLTPSCHAPPPWVQQQQRKGKQGHARRPKGEATTHSTSAPQAGAGADSSQQQQAGSAAVAGGVGAAGKQGDVPSGCLWGSVRWADNVEDEWWVVHLLRTITAQLPDVSAQVWDNDGEFLLIEAAFALPRWVKPDTAANRVWLRGGALHIIPQASTRAPHLPAFPTLTQALQILSSGTVKTLAQRADEAIALRLAGHPAAGQAAGRHLSRMVLPVRLAAVLRREPQLVGAAVEAFFYRDADDMHAAARMSHFPPAEARVPVLVATNRCQYAQLAQQRFAPPRGWRLPPPGHPLAVPSERGLKLTAGFEILAARAQRMGLQAPAAPPTPSGTAAAPPPTNVSTTSAPGVPEQGVAAGSPSPSPSLSERDVARHPLWPAYKASLQGSGYFQGELQGSARYQTLMASAVRDFTTSAQQAQVVAVTLPAQRLVQLMTEPQVAGATEEEFVAAGEGAGGVEDADTWMEEMGAKLDAELGRREAEEEGAGAGACAGAGWGAGGGGGRRVDVDAGDVAGAVKGFMDYALSGLEGAEVPGAKDNVTFDSSLFFRQLENVLGGLAGAAGVRSTKRAKQEGGEGQGAGGDDDDEAEDDDEEGWETTDGEGSSFFSDEEEDEEDDDEEEEEEQGSGSDTGNQPWAKGPGRGAAGAPSTLQLLDTTPDFKSARQPTATSAPSGGRAVQPQGPTTGDISGGAGAARVVSRQQRAGRHTLASLQEHWEVCTATDSDDDRDEDESDDDGEEGGSEEEEEQQPSGARAAAHRRRFHAAYDQVLNEQLASTTLAATVQRAPAPGTNPTADSEAAQGGQAAATAMDASLPGGGGSGRDGEPAQGAAAGEGGSGGGELQPLDLDFNLVCNLLKSVAEQQGMAGPASNLAGLLGIKLPHGADPNSSLGPG